jgi:uncharacterized protein YdaU (DUF1376 family)
MPVSGYLTMHYYQFNISVWALHTSHLSLEEEGVYRRLLDYYYDTESPIPKETKPVIRRLRLVNHEQIVDQILSEFFVLLDDGWHNNRADIEISEYHNKSNKARENGKKGGRPKQNQGSETDPVILANPEETTSKANYKLLTSNYELDNTLAPSERDRVPAREIIELFNRVFTELPEVRLISDKRLNVVKARWKATDNLKRIEQWERFFNWIKQSDFLMGREKTEFKCSFDWIFKAENFAKIYEGNYHK